MNTVTVNDATESLGQSRLESLARFQAGFLANTSHELRAPINQIISLHQLILEGLCEDPAEEREFLQQSFAATQRVLKNLDLLISISKLEIGRVRPHCQALPLQDVIGRVHQQTQILAQNRSCRLTLPVTAVEVNTDADWLTQALTLLIEAAIAAQSAQITLHCQRQTEAVELRLQTDSDLGCWQTLPALEESTARFSPLHLSPTFSLQLVEQIVRPLGGQVHTAFQEAEGAAVVVTLPVS